MEQIEIKTKIQEREFIKLQFLLYYRRPFAIILMLIGIAVLISTLIGYSNGTVTKLVTTPSLMAFIFVFVVPIGVWFNARKAMRTNKYLQEELTYTIDQNDIEVKGASFESKYTTSSVHRFKENKDFLLLYLSKQTFNIIPKRSVNEEQLMFIRQVLN